MAQLPLLPAGPIATAVSRLMRTGGGESPDPAAFLADLLDLKGGVTLSDALADLPPPGGALPTTDAAGALILRMRDEIVALSGRLDDAVLNAYRARYRLPGPVRAHVLLDQAGALAPKRTPRTVISASRTLWAPYADFLETHLKRARFGLRDLRTELGPRLQALGPSSDRLERLDAALQASTAVEVERLLRRGLHGVEDRFLDGLKSALKALPKTPAAADLEPWYTSDGFVTQVFDDGCRLVQGIFAHERSRLEMLVHAATFG